MVSARKDSIATDQIRVVDRTRIGSKIGELSPKKINALKEVMLSMLIE